MRAWLVLIALSACTTTRQEDLGSTDVVYAVGSTCPSGGDAMATIERRDVGGVTEINNTSSCTVDDVLTVADPSSQAPVTSCCYAYQCSPSETVADATVLFEATCRFDSCAANDLSVFTPARAAADLAMYLPACTIAPAATSPTDTATVTCDYIVDERETCYSGGLGS